MGASIYRQWEEEMALGPDNKEDLDEWILDECRTEAVEWELSNAPNDHLHRQEAILAKEWEERPQG